MSKTQKILLGILTVIPAIMIPLVAVRAVFFGLHMSEMHQEPDAAWILSRVATFAVPLILLGLLRFGLMVYYIIHAVNNRTIESTEKVIWVVLFILLGTLSTIIYWIIRIWDDNRLDIPINDSHG